MSCRSQFELFYHYIPFLTFRNYFWGGGRGGGKRARDGGEKGVSGGRKEGQGRRKRGKGDEGKEGLKGSGT